MKRFLLFSTALLVLACAAAGSASIQKIFQKCTGCAVETRGAWDALSIDEIAPENGPFFVEFGVDSCVAADFHRGGRTYRVEMYSFLTAKGALGAYEFTASSGAGPAGPGFRGRTDGSSLQFIKGNYLVDISPERAEGISGALELARLIEKQIPGTVLMPELYTPLPKDGLVKGSEYYFKGARTFAARFSPELGEALTVAGISDGVAGRYALEPGNEVHLVKLRFAGRQRTLMALQSFLESRGKSSISKPGINRDYYTVFNEDGSMTFIAEFGDWLFFLPDTRRDGKAQKFFEFALRSM